MTRTQREFELERAIHEAIEELKSVPYAADGRQAKAIKILESVLEGAPGCWDAGFAKTGSGCP